MASFPDLKCSRRELLLSGAAASAAGGLPAAEAQPTRSDAPVRTQVRLTAAVANAIHNATGVRVRDDPITIDKLLGKLAEAA